MVAREGLVAENVGNSAGAELLRGRVQRSGKSMPCGAKHSCAIIESSPSC